MTSPPKIFPTVMPSSAGSLASRFLSLANGKPKTTTDGCGPSSSESFAMYDPESSLWKTFQGSFLPDSETSSVVWPRQGMTRSGRAYRLPRLVPHISAGGSSLWPTPAAQESSPTQEFVDEMLENQPPKRGRVYLEGRKWHSQVTLSRAVQMWPTPQARDWKGPTGDEYKHGEAARRQSLPGRVMWPTPTVGQHIMNKLSVPPSGERGQLGHAMANRDRSTVGGQLNPEWVEALMGFPTGWTELGNTESTEQQPESPTG